jgi:hypothetical protein
MALACPHPADPGVACASAYLLAQADQQFAEARHRMKFPHAVGFSGSSEDQSGDIFARATLANLFLDIADLLQAPEWAASLRVATYQNVILTTAFCLRAPLLQVSRG